jgi:hypothetical protein
VGGIEQQLVREETTMKETAKQPADERKPPQLQVFRGDAEHEDEAETILDFEERAKQEEVEAYWAGRNLAMRRSARAAA